MASEYRLYTRQIKNGHFAPLYTDFEIDFWQCYISTRAIDELSEFQRFNILILCRKFRTSFPRSIQSALNRIGIKSLAICLCDINTWRCLLACSFFFWPKPAQIFPFQIWWMLTWLDTLILEFVQDFICRFVNLIWQNFNLWLILVTHFLE